MKFLREESKNLKSGDDETLPLGRHCSGTRMRGRKIKTLCSVLDPQVKLLDDDEGEKSD